MAFRNSDDPSLLPCPPMAERFNLAGQLPIRSIAEKSDPSSFGHCNEYSVVASQTIASPHQPLSDERCSLLIPQSAPSSIMHFSSVLRMATHSNFSALEGALGPRPTLQQQWEAGLAPLTGACIRSEPNATLGKSSHLYLPPR